jgi:hypothetical protein
VGRKLRTAVIVVLVSAAPIFLLEGTLRLAGWPTSRVRTFGKLLNFDPESWNGAVGVFQPGAQSRILWPPDLAYDVRINALGLRGEEIERTPPAGRVRILALGDSMTFGYYLEEDETWPAQLQAWLRSRGFDVEVVNAGSGGWTIGSQAIFFEERGRQLEPQQVVVGFSSNDLTDLERGSFVFSGQQDSVGSLRGPVGRAIYESALYELALRFRVWWKHFRETRAGTHGHPLVSFDPTPERKPALWAQYGEWLDRLHTEAQESGAALTMLYIPDAYKLAHDLPADDERRLRELCEERGIGFVSPLPDYEGRPGTELFHLPLDPHIAPEGAALVARSLGDYFAERL